MQKIIESMLALGHEVIIIQVKPIIEITATLLGEYPTSWESISKW